MSRRVTMKYRDLDGKAFTLNHVYYYPLIFEGCAVNRTEAKPVRSKTTLSTQQLEATEKKGDLLIRDLWQSGTDSVHNMHVVNTEAKYH